MGLPHPSDEDRVRFTAIADDVHAFAVRQWRGRVCAVNYLRGTLRGPITYEVRLDERTRERATVVFIRRNPDAATFSVVDTSHP